MAQDIRDSTWFTAHIRMGSEARLRTQSLFLNVLIFWFSTILTCLTVYQLTADKDPVRDIVSAALAIIVLALSIFIPSLGLDKQATQFRECYLKLQRLLDTVSDDAELTSSYYDILDSYPNHTSRDYTDFVVRSKYNNQGLTTSGTPVLPTMAMYFSFWFRRVAGVVMAISAVLSPGLLYFLL